MSSRIRISQFEHLVVQRGIARLCRSTPDARLQCQYLNNRDAYKSVSFALRASHRGNLHLSCRAMSPAMSTWTVMQSAPRLAKKPGSKPVPSRADPKACRPALIILSGAVTQEFYDRWLWPKARKLLVRADLLQ